jgi:DNA-binding transcriptional regulator LsrR (DeoR family)
VTLLLQLQDTLDQIEGTEAALRSQRQSRDFLIQQIVVQEGLSQNELARKIGLSVGWVNRAVARGRSATTV